MIMNGRNTPTSAEMVIEAIRDIQTQKRAARRHPDHALLIQDGLYDRVRSSLTLDGFRRVLAKLAASGRIRLCRTINDDCVSVVEE